MIGPNRRRGLAHAQEPSGLVCEGCNRPLAFKDIRPITVYRETPRSDLNPVQPTGSVVSAVICPRCAPRYWRTRLDPLLWRK